LQWPGLPTPLVDAIAIVSIFAMLAILVNRLRNPVLRFLSTFEDYLTWTVTLLPLLTGYFAFHRMLFPYQTMLGLHILSVEILLILFPFTKLMHFFTVFISRWYNGAAFGRRGVQS
jgi:nitrate reductase gamma subunit